MKLLVAPEVSLVSFPPAILSSGILQVGFEGGSRCSHPKVSWPSPKHVRVVKNISSLSGCQKVSWEATAPGSATTGVGATRAPASQTAGILIDESVWSCSPFPRALLGHDHAWSSSQASNDHGFLGPKTPGLLEVSKE